MPTLGQQIGGLRPGGRAAQALVQAQGLGHLAADGVHGVERTARVLKHHGNAVAAQRFCQGRFAWPSTSCVCRRMLPLTWLPAGCRPSKLRVSRLLPQPDSPTTPRQLPRCSLKLIWRRACSRRPPGVGSSRFRRATFQITMASVLALAGPAAGAGPRPAG